MDPVSLAASIITLLGASTSAVKFLENVREAPAEVHALINEVSEFQVVLFDIRAILEDGSPRSDAIGRFTQLLQKAESTLMDINKIIHYDLIEPGTYSEDGGVKFGRIKWLRKRSKLRQLLQALRSSSKSIDLELAGIASSRLSRLDLRLHHLSIVNQDADIRSTRFEEHVTRTLKENQSSLLDMSSSLSRYSDSVALMHTRDANDNDPTLTDTGSTNCLPVDHDRVLHQLSGALLTDHGHLSIQATVHYDSECQSWCSCACHERHKLATPRLLRELLGRVYVGYQRKPLEARVCDQHACKRRAPPIAVVSYQFPLWLLSRMIFATIASNPPQISLKVVRILSSDAPIFEIAREGDVETMKRLFAEGLASPHDISAFGKYSVLQYAVRYNRVEATRLLLKANADPLQENEWHESAADEAWNHIFRRPIDETEGLRDIFHDIEPLNKRQFSSLHRIILNITSATRSLRLELEDSTSHINYKDSQGKTALFWAAQRGCLDSVRLLLEHGADPNLYDNAGLTALHGAASAPSQLTACVEALLVAGADATFKNIRGFTPLHFTCHHTDNDSVAELLIKAGLDIESRDAYGQSALGIACRRNHVRTAKMLMAYGADIEASDKAGYTPLLGAVLKGSKTVLRLLLNRKANLCAKTQKLQTVLHLVAAATPIDQEILTVLMAAENLDLDLNAEDREGRTAITILAERNVSPEAKAIFENFARRTSMLKGHRRPQDTWETKENFTLPHNIADMSIRERLMRSKRRLVPDKTRYFGQHFLMALDASR